MLSVFGRYFMQSGAQGALPTLYAALGSELVGGEAPGPAGKKETKGPPTIVQLNADAQDADQRGRLWSISEGLCEFKYPL